MPPRQPLCLIGKLIFEPSERLPPYRLDCAKSCAGFIRDTPYQIREGGGETHHAQRVQVRTDVDSVVMFRVTLCEETEITLRAEEVRKFPLED